MPWETPTLQQLRELNRDNVVAKLRSGPLIPNSGLRIIADANSGLGFLCLLYLDWLAKQLLPDTAEAEWLDRWATLFLSNADGTKGRKKASFSGGWISISGLHGTPIPQGSILTAQSATTTGGAQTISFQVVQQTTLGSGPTSVPISAISVGAVGNLTAGSTLSFATAISGVNGSPTVTSLTGGADTETTDELRARVENRLQQPPMGGDANDYVQWALMVPGVTRAWCSPLEMGIGTVTVRFMMDDLRASQGGFPTDMDVEAVQNWIDFVRPVTVLDSFVVAPIPEPVSFTLNNLESNDASTVANIEASVSAMLAKKAAPAFSLNGVQQPAQTIFAAWVSDAVLNSIGVTSFDLVMTDHLMPTNGSLATLGDIIL